MKIGDFFRDRLGEILFSFFSGAAVIFYMYLLGIQPDIVLLVALGFLFVFLLFWGCDFWKEKRRFARLEEIMDRLAQKYLIADLMPEQFGYTACFYRELLRRACKAMNDEIAENQKKSLDYEEYIANWIHEVKTPLTAIQLLCDNDRSSVTNRIKLETKKIEMDVERMMYYSKAGETWKDYVIAPQPLNDIVEQSILKIYQIMIHHHVSIENQLKDEVVYTDSKWSSFVITQILLNCVQYRKDTPLVIRIYAEHPGECTRLIIEDNGLGIREDELPYIFEKGYVGTNGRKNDASSGMGMYICKKLCDKLGIGLVAESQYGVFTKMILTYGEGRFYAR